MTASEWERDFKSFIDELQMPRDDYKGIMAYIEDGAKLLKEKEPRVMTLEEVQQMGLRNINKDDIDDPDEVCYLERTERLSAILCSPLWSKKEFDGDENHLAILFFFLATDEFDNWHVDTYGHVIRCWTRPPTKEQMEATPWE